MSPTTDDYDRAEEQSNRRRVDGLIRIIEVSLVITLIIVCFVSLVSLCLSKIPYQGV